MLNGEKRWRRIFKEEERLKTREEIPGGGIAVSEMADAHGVVRKEPCEKRCSCADRHHLSLCSLGL